MKPLLAFTSGDPGGIGPETAVKAAADRKVRAVCRPLFIGPLYAFKKAGWHAGLGPVLDTGGRRAAKRAPSAEGGRQSFAAVRLAVKLALDGEVDGIVTGPVSKQSWAMARTGFLGHTEFLRHSCRAKEAVMSFIAGPARCALVTEHLPVKKLSSALTRSRIERSCRVFISALKELGIKHPKLALCALNPHAGDNGEIGREELDSVIPAAKALRRGGASVDGPLPADSAWKRHLHGEWDALVCLYHDQALIPLKISGHPAAHWTCGLPIIRTSPAHGTAFDIAWRGKADPSSAIAAALLAARLAGRRRKQGPAPQNFID